MTDGGKGSKPRPFSVSQEEYANRWDMIFGRDLDRRHEVMEEEEEESKKENEGDVA